MQSKKTRQQNISSIKHSYLKHSTKNIIPNVLNKLCLPYIKPKNKRKQYIDDNFINTSKFMQGKKNQFPITLKICYSSDTSQLQLSKHFSLVDTLPTTVVFNKGHHKKQ